MSEIYKGWKIYEVEYGYYEATNLEDCDSGVLFSKSVEVLKIEIDEKQEKI